MELRSICRALLVLDVAYCAAAVIIPDLPAWKMFEATEAAPFTLRDADGSVINHVDWLPKNAKDLSESDAIRLGRWLCKQQKVATPISIDSPRVHQVIEPPSCVNHDPR